MWFGGLIGLVVVLHNRVGTARRAGEMTVTDPVIRQFGAVTRRAETSQEAELTAVLERTAPPGRVECRSRKSTMTVSCPEPSVWSSGSRPWPGSPSPWCWWPGTMLAIAEVGSVANLFESGYGQTCW